MIVYEGQEISVKGGGGPTCLTRPIVRAPANWSGRALARPYLPRAEAPGSQPDRTCSARLSGFELLTCRSYVADEPGLPSKSGSVFLLKNTQRA